MADLYGNRGYGKLYYKGDMFPHDIYGYRIGYGETAIYGDLLYKGEPELDNGFRPAYITYEAFSPIVLNQTFTQPAAINFYCWTPTVNAQKDIEVIVKATKIVGSAPLVVYFTAEVKFSNNFQDYFEVYEYHWFFDYVNSPSVYEITSSNTASHVYVGYRGQTFSVRCEAKIKRK